MDSDSRTIADEVAEQIAKLVAGSSTRRSFLGRAARLVFGILGVQLLPARPVFAQGSAPAWESCGAYGTLCAQAGGTDYGCPTGCSAGTGAWRACCTDDQGASKFIDYYDCFKLTGQPPSGSKSIGQKGLACIQADSPKPTYGLPNGTIYCCSIIRNTGVPCNP